MPYLLSYATGTMLATAVIGLIPEALGHISIYEVGISLLAGLVLFFVLEWTVIWRHAHGGGTRRGSKPGMSTTPWRGSYKRHAGKKPGCWS